MASDPAHDVVNVVNDYQVAYSESECGTAPEPAIAKFRMLSLVGEPAVNMLDQKIHPGTAFIPCGSHWDHLLAIPCFWKSSSSIYGHRHGASTINYHTFNP